MYSKLHCTTSACTCTCTLLTVRTIDAYGSVVHIHVPVVQCMYAEKSVYVPNFDCTCF